MTSAGDLAKIVRLIATFIEGLTDDEIEALLSRRRVLQLSDTGTPRSKQRRKSKSVDPALVADALQQARSREEATAVLEGEGISKFVLEKLARQFDLPVLRSDSVERLRQRLVESAIGFRINSEAIRGARESESPR